MCLCEFSFLGEVRCVNTDSIHIICSTNCVHCTITNPAKSENNPASNDIATSQAAEISDEPLQTEYSLISDESSETEYSFASDEPYTSEKLSRLRSGYKRLSDPSLVITFNFNDRQVSNSISLDALWPAYIVFYTFLQIPFLC